MSRRKFSSLHTNGQALLVVGAAGLLVSTLVGACVGSRPVVPFALASLIGIAGGIGLMWLDWKQGGRRSDDE
jgi:hypothetical protein